MDIRPIRNKNDLQVALAEIERLWGALEGTPDGDKLDVLATLVEAYEDKAYPIRTTGDPVDLLNYAISDMGRSHAELAHILGSRSRASEILSRKRLLTIPMIDKIVAAWHLPRDLLAMPYRRMAPKRPPPASQNEKTVAPTKKAAAKKDPGKSRAVPKKATQRRATA